MLKFTFALDNNYTSDPIKSIFFFVFRADLLCHDTATGVVEVAGGVADTGYGSPMTTYTSDFSYCKSPSKLRTGEYLGFEGAKQVRIQDLCKGGGPKRDLAEFFAES